MIKLWLGTLRAWLFAFFGHFQTLWIEVDLSEQRNLSSLSALRLEWWSWKEVLDSQVFLRDCKSYDLLGFHAPYYIMKWCNSTASSYCFLDGYHRCFAVQNISLKKTSPTLEKKKWKEINLLLRFQINELHFPFSF